MNQEGVNHRRRFLLSAATGAVGAVGAVGVAVPFVGSWQPSAKAKAAGAPIKVDVSKIQPGQQIIEEWRGKPVFIVRRTQEALDDIKSQDSVVADPDSEASDQPAFAQNTSRSIKPEILVVLGLCTHLGCSPQYFPEVTPQPFEANWKGGFFCPCHGSKYDLSGRVYSGQPAPLNLPVPPYRFVDDSIIVVGEEA